MLFNIFLLASSSPPSISQDLRVLVLTTPCHDPSTRYLATPPRHTSLAVTTKGDDSSPHDSRGRVFVKVSSTGPAPETRTTPFAVRFFPAIVVFRLAARTDRYWYTDDFLNSVSGSGIPHHPPSEVTPLFESPFSRYMSSSW